MKKKQPQAASQQRRQPATNPKVRLKRSGGSAGDDSVGDAKKVSSPIQPKSSDLAVLDEKKRPRSRNPRSEVATIGDDAGVDPVRTKKAGSAATATRSAAPAITAVVEPPVTEKVGKGTKGVRRNTEMPSLDEKKPAVEPVVRSLRNRAVVFEVGSSAVQKDGGALPDSTANTRKPEKKVSTEVDVGGAESLSPRRGRKRGRSDDSVEAAEEITAVEPTKGVEPTKVAGAGSDRRVVSKQRKPNIPLPPRRPTRSSAQDEVSVPAPDVSVDERMAKKQKLDSAASTKSVPSEAPKGKGKASLIEDVPSEAPKGKGKASVIEEAPRRPTRSAIHNEVPVPAFLAKENVSAVEEAPRRSRRSSSIYNPFPVPASVVSGVDEMVDAKKNADERVDTKKKQADKTVLANLSPSEAKKEESVLEEPPKRSTRRSAHIEVPVPAPVVSAAGEKAGKKKADSEVEKGKLPPVVSAAGEKAGKKKADSEVGKGKLPVREEPPRRSTRSSTLDVPGGEIPLPESDMTVDDKKVVKKKKRGREITPPKASDGEPPVVKEFPRRSRRSSIGGLPADEISLPAFDISTQEEKVVEKKVPGKRVPAQIPKTEAAAAPVEAPKVKIPKLEVSPRRATRMSICPVPKHDSLPQNLGDDNISFNKKEKGKQAKKFQPVKKTLGNPTPKVEATSDAEKVRRGKVSEYVKPLGKPTLKKDSGGKQAQKQRRARKASENSAPTSKDVTKAVEVREESQKALQPEKPPRRTRHTARDVDVSIVRTRKSGDDEVLPRGRGVKRQVAEATLELKEQIGNKRQKQSGRWSMKDRSHLASEVSVEGGSSVKSDTFAGPEADDGLATDLSTVAPAENDDLPERTVSEMQQSTLPDPIAGDDLKELESCKSQEGSLHVGLDVSPDSENQPGQIEVISIAREISLSEVVVASVVTTQGFSNVEVAADMAKEVASDGTPDFESNDQCSNVEKEVGSSSMSHVVYVEPTGTPMMTSSCISPGKMISDEASPAIPTQDCSNVAINVDMAREAASDGDLDFKSDIQETVKEVDSHTIPHVVYVESISTPVMDGSCIAQVETISNEANVEGNETTYTVGVPLSLPRTKDLPLPEITEANTESENEEPAVPAFTRVAAEISSQLNSCSPVQASCHQEKNIGLLVDSNLTDLSCTREVCSSEASPVKNDDAKDSIEQASCHSEKSIGILAEPADRNLEELCRSEVRAYGEAPATPVESEDGKESVGLASCHQEKSIGLLADSTDGNLAEALHTKVVGRSEVQAFGAALTTMLDAHSPVKSEDAKESIGQASSHQEKSTDNQVGEASPTMSDLHSHVKSEDMIESIGQASYHQEKSIGNQVDEALRTMSDPQVDEALRTMSNPHSPVKSEDAGESIGQASCHPEMSIGLLDELTGSNLAELSCTPVVPGSEVLGFGEALPTILGVHPPVKSDDVEESIGQASCHQENSIELLAEPADGNLELSSTQVVFRSDAQEFSEALPTMFDVQSPVKIDDVKESIGQASYHQEKSTGLPAEPEDGNFAKSQDVFASEVQEFGEALTTVVHAHSPMKSDDAKESIGHVADVTFAPREVSFGEGTNDDAETESKVSQTFLQNLASDECSDDEFPNNEPGIPSENIANGSLIVIGSSSAQKPNLLEGREPSSSKSFGEGCEDIVLEVAETLNTEVIVDDKDDNSLPHADAVTMSGDGFGNVGVADLDSVPKSMAGDTSLGEVSVVNEDDTLPFSLESKFVEYSEPDVVCTQVDDAEPYESASTFVDHTETEIQCTQVINAGLDESVSEVVEYVETLVANTQVVDAEPYESAGNFVEHTEAEVVSTQVIDAEPYGSTSIFVEHTEAEVVSTQVVEAEPYESAISGDGNFTDVIQYEDDGKSSKIHSTVGTSFPCGPVEDVEVTVSGSPGGLYSSSVAKAMNVTTTSGERSTEDENIVPNSLSLDRDFDKHTEIQVLSRDVTDAEPYESTIHGIGNSTVVLPNDDGDKLNGVTRSSGTSSFREPAEDADVVLGSSRSIISPVAEDKAGATSADKLSADSKDGLPSPNMDSKFDRNAETQVFSSHFVGTEPHESIDAIQSEGDEGALLSCGASAHGGSRFTEVLPFGDGDKYNEGTQTVGGSFICESAEHSDGNATAVLATDDGDKCIEGTSSVSASISYGPTEQSVKILTELLPYEGDGKSNEITPTVGASISCGPTEHDTNILTDVLLNEDGNRCNEVTVTADASFSFGAGGGGVGNIFEHDLNNLTDVLPDEGGDNRHEAAPADIASTSAGPVDASLPSGPAEEGVDNIIEQDLNNLTEVHPYEGADDKCNEVTTTVDSFSFGPAEDAVGNIIDQDLDNLTEVLPYEATPTYCASFSSRPAEEGVSNIIDQDSENLHDVPSQEGDDKCNEVTVTVDASSTGPAEDDVGNILNQDLVNLPVVLPDEGDNKCNEATITVETSSSGPAEDVVGNIINQDLPVVLPDEGDNKCNEATVTVDALSSGCAEDGVGNVIGQDLNNLTDELPYEGGYLCNEATVTVGASLPSRPAEEGGSIINDVLLYADKDKCGDVVPTVGESISSGPTEHGLENLSDVLPFEDSKNYNEVTSTVDAVISCTPTEDVDGNFTNVLRYGVGDKSNDGTRTFGASSCGPVEHDVGNLTDEPPHDEGYKSNEGTSPVGMSEDLQVTALGSPGGFDDSSVVEAMAGTTSELRLDAKEEFALPSLSVDSQIDKHTETQVLSAQVADVEPYDSTIHGNIEVGDKCDEVTGYVGDNSEPAEVVEVTAMELTAEEDLDGSKISSDSNAMAFVTSEEELTMQAVNAEPHESSRLGNNEGDDQCNEGTRYIGTSFSAGTTEAVESIALEGSTTVEVTTVEVTTVEVTTVEVTTVEVTDVEDPGLKITSDSNVMAGATSEGELNTQVEVAEPSESTLHGNNDGGEVANYADVLLSSGPAEVMEVAAVEDSALKTSSDLNVTRDAISEGELGMQDADAEPSETTTHGKHDVAEKCDDVAIDVGSSFSPRLAEVVEVTAADDSGLEISSAEVVEVTAADDSGLEISSDANVVAGVPSEVELSMQVADAEPIESAIHGNSEGSDKRDDATSHVGTSVSSETAEVVDVIAVEDPGLNIGSDSNAAARATATGELTPDSEE